MKKKINKMMILIATVTILLTMVLITVVYYDLFRRQVLEDLKSYGLLLSNCSSVEEIEQSGVPVESDLRLTIIGSDGRVFRGHGKPLFQTRDPGSHAGRRGRGGP